MTTLFSFQAVEGTSYTSSLIELVLFEIEIKLSTKAINSVISLLLLIQRLIFHVFRSKL